MLPAVTASLVAPSQPSVFDKCQAMTQRVAIARAEDAYCYFRVIESPQDPEVIVGGRKLVMLGSNNYLGLTNHPKVKEAAVEAVRRFGTGCAGSRLLNGTLSLHEALEAKLARFIGKPAVVTFSTGFQVNLGAISSLLDRGDVVYLDKQDHACIIDGARLSFARIRKFEHNDPEELRRLMRADAGDQGAAGRGGRRVLHGGRYRAVASDRGGRRRARSRGDGRRCAWRGCPGPSWPRHGGALRPRGQGASRHGDLLQIAGIDRGLHRRRARGHRPHPPRRPEPDLLRGARHPPRSPLHPPPSTSCKTSPSAGNSSGATPVS